ncbi:hypothetical protein M9Y10_011918 [Tritrichomonas musculus]|uniref:IQ calmodulin-binding motif family protein n=1 Tax=Tritrichomonas musculus TaxID=1915356 RepID=A0ABR2IB66_9EUKA
MQTFSLTAIQSKSALQKKKAYKPLNELARSSSSLEAPGPFTKNINQLKKSVNYYETKNKEIQETIDLLNGAMETMDERRQLFKLFDRDLNTIYDRLDQRFTELFDTENIIKSFRQAPEGKTTLDKVQTLPTKEIDRKQLLNINQELVQMALAQERQMVVMKMRLRLCHDHRDLSRLRRILNKLQGGGSDYREDEEITAQLKKSIHHLKFAIAQERERIRLLQLDGMEEHEAATIIQKQVRGFLYRIKNCSKPKQITSTPINEEEERNENLQEEEENGDHPRPAEAPAPAANDSEN